MLRGMQRTVTGPIVVAPVDYEGPMPLSESLLIHLDKALVERNVSEGFRLLEAAEAEIERIVPTGLPHAE